MCTPASVTSNHEVFERLYDALWRVLMDVPAPITAEIHTLRNNFKREIQRRVSTSNAHSYTKPIVPPSLPAPDTSTTTTSLDLSLSYVVASPQPLFTVKATLHQAPSSAHPAVPAINGPPSPPFHNDNTKTNNTMQLFFLHPDVGDAFTAVNNTLTKF